MNSTLFHKPESVKLIFYLNQHIKMPVLYIENIIRIFKKLNFSTLSPFFYSYPQKSVQQTKPVQDLCDYTLCIYSYVISAKISENMPPYIAFS